MINKDKKLEGIERRIEGIGYKSVRVSACVSACKDVRARARVCVVD